MAATDPKLRAAAMYSSAADSIKTIRSAGRGFAGACGARLGVLKCVDEGFLITT